MYLPHPCISVVCSLGPEVVRALACSDFSKHSSWYTVGVRCCSQRYQVERLYTFVRCQLTTLSILRARVRCSALQCILQLHICVM